jgi:hypothetical protein
MARKIPTKILPFPAKTCCFFVHGRCCAPDPRQAFGEGERQCRVLELWERLYDEALGLAEKWHLDKNQAVELVAGNLEQAQDLDRLCLDYQADGTDSVLDCIFSHEHLCIQTLPPCTGICPRFRAQVKSLPDIFH